MDTNPNPNPKNTKLNESAVIAAIALHNLGFRQVDIAKLFGVTQPAISDALRQVTHKSVTLTPKTHGNAVLTPAEVTALKALRCAGWKYKDLARLFGISPSRAHKLVTENQSQFPNLPAPKRSGKVFARDIPIIHALKRGGLTLTEIAQLIRVSPARISQILRAGE